MVAFSQVFGSDVFHFPSSGRSQVHQGGSRLLGADLSRPPPSDASTAGIPGYGSPSRSSKTSFTGTASSSSSPSSTSPIIRSTSFLNLVPRSVANLFSGRSAGNPEEQNLNELFKDAQAEVDRVNHKVKDLFYRGKKLCKGNFVGRARAASQIRFALQKNKPVMRS